MTTRRQLTTALSAAITATLLTACGASGEASSTPEGTAPGPDALAAAAGPVTVTLWHGLGGTGGEALQTQVEAFNAANAGSIEVKAVFQGSYVDTLAKYTSAVRDQSTPSILITNDVSTGFVRDAGQTVTAQALAAANPDGLDLDTLVPAARGYYTAGDELLAVPVATSMPLLYVNEGLLEEAGVKLSSLDTLDGVAAAARAVHQARPDVAGIVQPFDGWWFEQLTAASGSPYCTPDNGRGSDGATGLSLTGDAQQAAFDTMADLYTDGVGLDTGPDGNNALTAFAAGQAAMMFNSSGSIGGLRTAGASFTALPYPLSGPPESSGAVIGGAAMWVSGPGHSDAEQVASWEVVSYLASAEAQEPFAQTSGYAPVNTEVAVSPTEQAYLSANPAAAVLAEQLATTPATVATSGCLSGAMTQVRSEVVPQMQAAFSGSVSLADGLAEAQEASDAAIADYREQAGQ